MKASLLELLKDFENLGLLKVLKSGEELRVECEKYLSKGLSSSSSSSIGKRSRGRPRKECVEKSKKSEDAIGRLMACEVEEEESIKVKKILIDDKNYLISSNNTLYCPESHEEIGSYINKELVLYNE